MKITLKWTVGALMAIGIAQSNAADKTIWVQPLNFALTAWEDGNSKAVRVSTKDVIHRLNGLTPTGGSVLDFSTKAKLLRKVDTTLGDNGTIVVRDGNPKVDIDVSEFFSLDNLTTVNGHAMIINSVSISNNFKIVTHSLNEFSFNGNGASFDLAGFTESKDRNLISTGTTVTQTAKANVLGSGTVDTSEAVVNGTVSLGGGKLEEPLIP